MKIPITIESLILLKLWPNNSDICDTALKDIVNVNTLKSLITDEDQLYLFSPPFVSIKYCIEKADEFYAIPEVEQSLKKIDISKTIIIGDFGYGSEAELALDYSNSEENPNVIRMKWHYDDKQLVRRAEWVFVSKSIEEFFEIDCDILKEKRYNFDQRNKSSLKKRSEYILLSKPLEKTKKKWYSKLFE